MNAHHNRFSLDSPEKIFIHSKETQLRNIVDDVPRRCFSSVVFTLINLNTYQITIIDSFGSVNVFLKHVVCLSFLNSALK